MIWYKGTRPTSNTIQDCAEVYLMNLKFLTRFFWPFKVKNGLIQNVKHLKLYTQDRQDGRSLVSSWQVGTSLSKTHFETSNFRKLMTVFSVQYFKQLVLVLRSFDVECNRKFRKDTYFDQQFMHFFMYVKYIYLHICTSWIETNKTHLL